MLEVPIILPFPGHPSPDRAVSSDNDAPFVAARRLPGLNPAPTIGEKEALVISRSCRNVGSLSPDARRTTVAFTAGMNRDGAPVTSSIRPASSSGAARQAYQAARRAIIRCGTSGRALPRAIVHRQTVEMTFDSSGLRLR